MKKLPLIRVVEVAFTTTAVEKSVAFYKTLGLNFPPRLERLNFAEVGEQFFGVCNAKDGFIDGKGGFVKTKLHVAFEVPNDKIDECISFLQAKKIKTSPKVEWHNYFHGAQHAQSVYFKDPAGNIVELWAPLKN